jgi:protein-S-isoprenylcysteine O-methyltransferase Ste14
MSAATSYRREMWGLRFVNWFLGWQAWLGSWLVILAGGSVWDWFQRADGSRDWLKGAVVFATVPVTQWLIRRRISKDERMLPRLSSGGEIVYGADSDRED